MATPRSLKAIESAKAQAIIEKFTKNGQGYWDGPVVVIGDGQKQEII